jgi:cysteine sulfinate desulfinase/cysteine desulfurase-like protein
MGVPRDRALGAVRFSLGRTTTMEEIEEVIDQLNPVLARLARIK